MMNTRINRLMRMEAFDAFCNLRNNQIKRVEIINKINNLYKIPKGTLYDWYLGKHLPYGRKRNISYKPEIFYVLGALLGDGCIYRWKPTNNYVILVGDKNFTDKYAKYSNICTGLKIKPYIDRNKNIWFVRINNYELFCLFERARIDYKYLDEILMGCDKKSALLFIEGFFDAEGCVKIIKEKTRLTPKIYLDMTNTNLNYLDLIKKILQKWLKIESKYSIQRPTGNRKTTYHLRIYKKVFIYKFFKNISTTKLNDNKKIYVEKWLDTTKINKI